MNYNEFLQLSKLGIIRNFWLICGGIMSVIITWWAESKQTKSPHVNLINNDVYMMDDNQWFSSFYWDIRWKLIYWHPVTCSFLIKHPQLSDCKQVNKVTQQSFIEIKFHPVCLLLRWQKMIHIQTQIYQVICCSNFQHNDRINFFTIAK